jgi:uncharacterized membrane protein
MKVNKSRSLLKAITFRVVATISTVAIVFAFTGQIKAALGIGFIDTIVKLAIYYFHERAWNNIDYGRHPVTNN